MKWGLLLFMLLSLAGCGGEEFQDLRDWVKNAGADMRGKVEPPPEVVPYEPFTYENNDGLPDPFKPRKQDLKGVGGAGQNVPNLDRPKEELEEYPLESLKMIGYVHLKGVAYAVIRSVDGKVHHARAGNYMGLNFGQIVSVSETEAKIHEMIQDSVGDWSERESSLELIE